MYQVPDVYDKQQSVCPSGGGRSAATATVRDRGSELRKMVLILQNRSGERGGEPAM